MLRLLPLLLSIAALSSACDAPITQPTWPLEVRSPVVGEVWVDGELAVVDPLAPARLEVPSPPPFTVTFIGDDGPLTVVDVPGPRLDLRAFVDGPEPVRGTLIELRIRVLDGPAQVVGVADGQVFAAVADADGQGLRIAVPQSPDLLLVGLWRADGRATHITRRAVPDPALVADRDLILAPEAALDQSVPITVAGGPGGALTAELTERGLRTGLLLGAGRIDPGVAVAIPRPAVAAAEVGLWVRVEDGGAEGGPRRTVEAALDLDGPGAALDWSDPPGILPAARGPEAPAFFDAAARRWQLTDVGEPSWLEVVIDGRGDCVGLPWRIILPPTTAVVVPPAVGLDPLDAPLIDLRVIAVTVQGADRDALLADGASPIALPGRLTARRTAALDSVWRTDPADCPSDARRGLYAIDGPGAVCSARIAPPSAVVTRCGALAPLSEGATLCGQFVDDGFDSVVHGLLGVSIEDEQVVIDAPEGPIALFPRPDPEARPPADAVGDWSRFTLARQPVDAEGRATAEAIVIESGVATPVATIDADGRITVRAAQWAFDARLMQADADAGLAEVHTAGCAARPSTVDLRWSGDTVEIVGQAIDGDDGRRWTLTLRR